MKRLLIFDAYGTLLSTGGGSLDAAGTILSLQDKDIDAAEFYTQWKKLHRKHIDETNEGKFISEQDIFVKDLKLLYEQYLIRRPYQEDVHIMLDSLYGRIVFPEVASAVEKLREKYRLVIGSTTDTEPLMSNLKSNRLNMDAVYTSEIIRKYKPHKDFYQYILKMEGYAPKDAVFIGDSLTDDVFGPQNVGMKAVLVDRKNKYSSTENIRPDYIVKSIEEIAELDFREVPKNDNP